MFSTGPRGRREPTAYERTFLGIAILVACVWAIANLVQIALPDHAVPQSVNVVMMAVAGAFFGGAVVSGRKGSKPQALNGDDPEDPDEPGGYYRSPR